MLDSLATPGSTEFPSMRVIDSHTGGEPTRLIVQGGPDLGSGPLAQRREIFRTRFDHIRSALCNEPRGSDAVVGALLCEPHEPGCAAGVIFFNNVGMLGMCGHGTIGLLATLAWMKRIQPGTHRIDTPVGVVEATLRGANHVSLRNVNSYRLHRQIALNVPGHGTVHGDVAWGGNWFFLVDDHGLNLSLQQVPELTSLGTRIRHALQKEGITGSDGAEIDHIELCGPSATPGVNGRNFVLCPGLAYDRSPCGTGTSAKLACLQADDKLALDQVWRQESVVGSVFEGSMEWHDGQWYPRIAGSAFVNAVTAVVLSENDPFIWGIPV